MSAAFSLRKVIAPLVIEKTLVADFPRTVSIYQGSDVRVLGVPIGKVDKVEPEGTHVAVTMHYDDKYQLPADAKALIVAPSIVGDRYVEVTPAYSEARRSPTAPRSARTGRPSRSSSTTSTAAWTRW